MLNLEAMQKELMNLKGRYAAALHEIIGRAKEADNKFSLGRPVSSHDAFNIGASASELATMAGKIEQTENVIRWMQEAK